MNRFYHSLLGFIKRLRGSKSVARSLPEAARQAALAEAAQLFAQFGVRVESLAAGEEAGLPRAANPEVEARFTAPVGQKSAE